MQKNDLQLLDKVVLDREQVGSRVVTLSFVLYIIVLAYLFMQFYASCVVSATSDLPPSF